MSARDKFRLAGFTLGELIVVLVCIGILGGVAAGGFRNLVRAGREEAAVGKARLLNAARWSYGLTVADGAQRWAACASDAERFALLSAAQLVEGESSDYLGSPGGYSLGMDGPLRGRTRLQCNGKTLNYR